MIVTCASCFTKFNLDESKIPPQGAKVRCSRCKHVFFVVPPEAPKEEIVADFESFAKAHKELVEPGLKKEVPPPRPKMEEEEAFGEEEPEEKFAVEEEEEKVPPKPVRRIEPRGAREERKIGAKGLRSERTVPKKKRAPSVFFALVLVVLILIFGGFYLLTALESGGKFSPYLEKPIQKVTELWDSLWGTQREGLVPKDLDGYEEKVGDVSLFVIEGKVDNQSPFNKKFIKMRVAILDQNHLKVAEKETFCGRVISREELKKLPPAFFKGDIDLNPLTEGDRVVSTGKAAPFIVVFKDLSSQAKEFKVEIAEAPNP